jgi:serpin B
MKLGKNVVATLSTALSILSAPAPARGAAAATDALASSTVAFALDLYEELADAEGNVFFSPYGVSTALAMTYAAASGNTASEMATALKFPVSPRELPSVFKDLSAVVQSHATRGGNSMLLANGLCLTGGSVDDEYSEVLRTDFDAEVFTGDLAEINGWAKEKTGGKIANILEKLSPNSVCVLLNAIYFKGSWASKFNREATTEAPFQLESGKDVTTPIMCQKGEFRLLERDGFHALCMPYSGNELSMVILLPTSSSRLRDLEKSLTTEMLAETLAEVSRQPRRPVQVFVPRFGMETAYDLVPPLKGMGVKDAFSTEEADFSGMGWKKGDLWISQVKHKAFVEVGEEGTEAAAATAVEMQTRSATQHPVFSATRPFIFVIRDDKNGCVLFMGRVADPTQRG